MTYRFLVFLLTAFMTVFCLASVDIGPDMNSEFNPASGQTLSIPVKISEAGNIVVMLYTPDGDLIRTLSGGKKDKAGIYYIVWDGKDQNNTVVPNEAYVPVVTLTTENNAYEFDPRKTSGGEEFTAKAKIDAQNNIIFSLDKPSRVLIRTGVKSGPLLNTVLNWQTRGKGVNKVLWDGYDRDNIINLVSSGNLALLVTGFVLPDHSIITTGNTTKNYLQWRSQNNLRSTMPDLSKVLFERNQQRLSRHYYLPRSVDIEPRITLSISEPVGENSLGIPIVNGPVLLKVDMNKEDRWAMQQSLYEVAFFLDYVFLSEEEQGYVPLTWRWSPAGVEPGIHTLTVNISGFEGQVGVHSVQIEVVPKNK
ncbi:hypothetical protein AB835_09670 [Candidatus Endobugula sertula]|uniref:FlgD Ig-like domain-containing protein n=1 Tax=Candidatus Endobugula sertula TaxID=62101 RepID=A0A1D2QNX3_9GAMM|nr:hypothetical protein AB835_09670 [Candidatus Endobugula sertula]